MPLDIAKVRLEGHLRAFLQLAENADPETPPPVRAIQAELGLGKSAGIRTALIERVRALRARGDLRPVVIVVPTHKLAREYAAALGTAAPDLTARAWLGRNAPAPDREGTMCAVPDRADEVRRLIFGSLLQR